MRRMTRRPRAETPSERRALAAAGAAVLAWSTVATGFKLGLAVLAPAQLLLLGTFFSWLVFVTAALVRGERLARGDAVRAAILGLVNPCAYYLVLFAAYARLPAQVAQPLNYTWAIVLAVLAVPVLGQRLARRTLAGIITSYAGVVLIASRNPLAPGEPLDGLGIALALASTVLWAGYWLANARGRSAPAPRMAVSFAAALPVLAVTCALGPGWPPVTTETLLFGAWVGLVEMGLTFLVWHYALSNARSAARVGQLVFLSPFLSLLMIRGVLGEPVGWRSVAGLAVIVGGLLLTGRPGGRAAR
ncbi:MAG: DMT family transporter [Gammaproteobacteria bacterium]